MKGNGKTDIKKRKKNFCKKAPGGIKAREGGERTRSHRASKTNKKEKRPPRHENLQLKKKKNGGKIHGSRTKM